MEPFDQPLPCDTTSSICILLRWSGRCIENDKQSGLAASAIASSLSTVPPFWFQRQRHAGDRPCSPGRRWIVVRHRTEPRRAVAARRLADHSGAMGTKSTAMRSAVMEP